MSNAQAELGDMYGKPITRRDIGKKCGFQNCPTVLNAYNTGNFCYAHASEQVKRYDNGERNQKYKTYKRTNRSNPDILALTTKDFMNVDILSKIVSNHYGVRKIYKIIESWDETKTAVENAKTTKIHPVYARVVAKKYGLKFKVVRLPNNSLVKKRKGKK